MKIMYPYKFTFKYPLQGGAKLRWHAILREEFQTDLHEFYLKANEPDP